MKRIFTLTIAFILVFGSIFPIYAKDVYDGGAKAYTAPNAPATTFPAILGFSRPGSSLSVSGYDFANGVLTALNNIQSGTGSLFNTWLGSMPNGWLNWSVFSLAWKDYEDIMEYWVTGVSPLGNTYAVPSWHAFTLWYDEVMDWLYPAQYSGTPYTNNELSLWDYTKLNTNNVANSLIPSVWNIEDNFEEVFLTVPTFFGTRSNGERYLQLITNAVVDWGFSSSNKTWGTHVKTAEDVTNLALQQINNNSARLSAYLVRDVPSILSIWDSQGDTLTQETWTPTSAFNGTYKYLAYTQRDIARLAYIFANDEELEARELAKANQEQVVDDFINPSGSGSISDTDLGAMSSASAELKDNFDTGVSASGVWNIFDSDNWNGWFSNQTRNELDTVQTRSGYPTPLLDEKLDILYKLIDTEGNDG